MAPPKPRRDAPRQKGHITRPVATRPPQVSCFGAERGQRDPVLTRLEATQRVRLTPPVRT